MESHELFAQGLNIFNPLLVESAGGNPQIEKAYSVEIHIWVCVLALSLEPS
jgi:hypothetical protein